MEKKLKLSLALIALLLLVGNVFLFWSKPSTMYFLSVVIIIATAIPFVIVVVVELERQKEKETKFLEFTRDLVEGVKSGTPINKAIFNVKDKNFGALSPHIKKLANQIEIGMPFSECLAIFSNDIKSPVISRATNLISEAEKSGGEIESVLSSVVNSISQIEILKKEQKTAIYSLVVQGYVIFIVFLAIVLVLQYYILPMTGGIGNINDLNAEVNSSEMNPSEIVQPLNLLLVVQSIFAGLVIGKIAEGNIKGGLKHSFILLSLTLLTAFGANAIFG